MFNKLAVIGGRTFRDYDLLRQTLSRFSPTGIISGGARGADALAARYAKENGIPLTEYKPDRNKHGRGMYMVRNRKIVDSADMLVAFWDGRSRGTKYTIGYARKQGVSVEVVEYSG